MWEKIKLSNNYTKALEQVCVSTRTLGMCVKICADRRATDRQRAHLLAELYDPQVQATRDKDYTVSHQNASREAPRAVRGLFCLITPSLRISPRAHSCACRPKLVGIKKKLDRREAVRERKALAAAHLERAIEKELLERLKSKAYGDAPLNVNESVWAAILDKEKARERGEELEDEETDEELEDDELEGEVEEEWGEREFVSDVSESEDELSDLEQVAVRGSLHTFWKRVFIMASVRTEWMVAATVKSRETMTRMTRTRARSPHQNQNRRWESEKRNSICANRNVRIYHLSPVRDDS